MFLSRFKSEHEAYHEAESVQLQSATKQRDGAPTLTLSDASASALQEGSTRTSGKVVFEGNHSYLGAMSTDHAAVEKNELPVLDPLSGFVIPDLDEVCSSPDDWGLDDRCEGAKIICASIIIIKLLNKLSIFE